MRHADYAEPRHPIRGDALTPLERELWRLRMVGHEAGTMMRGFRRIPDAAAAVNDDLFFSLANQATAIVCKFLEVWDSLGSLTPHEPRLQRVRAVVQPVVDRIRVWDGLDAFRDAVLAHAYLTSDDKLISPWYIISELGAPTYYAEVVFLLDLVNWAMVAALCTFETEYLPLRGLLASPRPTPGAGPGLQSGEEIGPALKAILGEMDAKLLAAGISVNTKLGKELAASARP